MSFSDRPNLNFWQKLGCLIYGGAAIFGCFYVAAEILLNFDPHLPPWQENAIIAGTMIAALAGGLILLRFFMRDEN